MNIPASSTLPPLSWSALRAGRYVIDPSHTRVLFSVSHFGLSTFFGEFTRPVGALLFDPARLSAARLSVSVPVANIATQNQVLDEELRSSDWLDSARFPQLELDSSKCILQSDGSLDVHAEMRLHGVSRQLVLTATLAGAGVNPKNQTYTVGFDVRGSLRRSDFGVTALPLIGDELQMIISAAFEFAPEQH